MDTLFVFRRQLTQVELLGRRASNITELRRHLKEIPDSSIFYHTHRFLRQHVIRSPEPPNDFAYWIAKALGLARLGETLSSLPFASFRTVAEFRQAFLAPLDAFLLEEGRQRPEAPPGMEFHFLSGRTFLLPTGYEVHSADEFAVALARVPIGAIQYHVFVPRLGMARPEDDFSVWFKSIGRADLADALSRLDPYTMTLETLRRVILQKVAKNASC